MANPAPHPTPYITRSGLSPVAVGRVRRLYFGHGYNAREIVRITGFEPADVRRVIYGSEVDAVALAARVERKRAANRRWYVKRLVEQAIAEGENAELVERLIGGLAG